jgi:hypothetical protein
VNDLHVSDRKLSYLDYRMCNASTCMDAAKAKSNHRNVVCGCA